MTVGALPAWSVRLGTAGCTCVRFICRRSRDDDPWPLTRVINELRAAGASMAERPRALGSGRGIPLIHSQVMAWCGTTLELEAHHLHDDGGDEISVTLPSWDELMGVVPHEDEVWEMLDIVTAGIMPRFGIIGDGEPAGALRCETSDDLRALLRRHTGVLVAEYSPGLTAAEACRYRELPRSGAIVLLR